MLKNQILALAILTVVVVAGPVWAQSAATTASPEGFYGGVALRNQGLDAAGVNFGPLTTTWGRFAPPVADDASLRRSLLFGGYRFAHDVAVEGSFSMADPHQLEPLERGTPRGVGLSLGAVPGAVARAWNADVYTTWSFLKSFSLYGRLGYAQNDASTSYAAAAQSPVDARLFRDGMNYGVGVRYDITRALGLRLEYARFPRFVGESVTGPLPDSDQVQFGMQFSF